MVSQPTKKAAPKASAGTGLQKKVGPFPVWAWGVLGIGSYYLYKKNGGAANLSATPASTAGTVVSPSGGLSSDGSSAGASGSGGGAGNGGGSGTGWTPHFPAASPVVPAATINTQVTPVSSGDTSMNNPVTQSGGTVGPTQIATTGGTVNTTNPNVKGYTVTGTKGTVVLGGALQNGYVKLSSPAQVKAAKAAGVTVGKGNTVKIPSK